MQILKKRFKNKGFILISTLILIIFIMGNFLLGYRIIFRKGERLNSNINSISINSQVHNLKILVYDELLRIDSKISSEEYKNGAEYIGVEENFNRVWLGNSKNSFSKNNYQIYKMKINGSTFYTYKAEAYEDFKEIISYNIMRSGLSENSLIVELRKNFTKTNDNSSILLTAIIQLEYKNGNKDPSSPDVEILKEFVANFE